jgi:hypothetical protein
MVATDCILRGIVPAAAFRDIVRSVFRYVVPATQRKIMKRVLLLTFAAAAAAGLSAPSRAAGFPPAMDWFLQDVCVDAKGAAIAGLSPASSACTSHRNLGIGEALPYHKQDLGTPLWEDSFPATVPGYGPVGVVIENEPPLGQYHPGNGAQITVATANAVSWVATVDHHGVVGYLGPNCGEPGAPAGSPQSRTDSWEIVGLDGQGHVPPSGQRVSHLARITGTPSGCAGKLDSVNTTWETVPFAWTIRSGGATSTVTLQTLVSTHASVQQEHAERDFFSRELGRMMWESLVNTDNPGNHQARQIDTGKYCPDAANYPTPPYPTGHWVIAGCREATAIVPTLSSSGFDAPPTSGADDYLQDLRSAPATAAMFSPAQQ